LVVNALEREVPWQALASTKVLNLGYRLDGGAYFFDAACLFRLKKVEVDQSHFKIFASQAFGLSLQNFG
jgi:hypothetical protein